VGLTAYQQGFSYQIPTTDPAYASLTRGASWTPAQLAVAVDSSALLPTSDTQYLTQAPNITAANVTITSAGSVGSNTAPLNFTLGAGASAPTATQTAALAAADPGDVSVTQSSAGVFQFQVRQENFVSVASPGTTTINAAGDIYLATPGTLAIANLATSAGDVRVQAGGSVQAGSIATPNDLSLEAAQGGLGAGGVALGINVGGTLTSTRSATDTLLASNAALTVGDMFAGGNLTLTGASIQSAFSDGLVRLEGDSISLISSGAIGGYGSPMEVQVNGGVLSLNAPGSGDVYVDVPGGGPVTVQGALGHDITLTNASGSFNFAGPVEGLGDVYLSAGSLFMTPLSASVPNSVIGGTVSLIATTGDIGSSSQAFNVAPPSQGRLGGTATTTTVLQVSAPVGSLYLSQLAPGNMTVGKVVAGFQAQIVVQAGNLAIQQFTGPSSAFGPFAPNGTVTVAPPPPPPPNGNWGYPPRRGGFGSYVVSLQAPASVGGGSQAAPVNTDDDEDPDL
ncbi:MAG: hypothetical protein ABI655_10500, partial [Phenylobacterium sp.]